MKIALGIILGLILICGGLDYYQSEISKTQDENSSLYLILGIFLFIIEFCLLVLYAILN